MLYRCCRPRAPLPLISDEVRPVPRRQLRLRRSSACPLALLLLLLAVSPSHAQSKLAGKYTKAGGNFFTVSVVKEGEVQLSMSGSYHENTCMIETDPLQLSGGVVTYQPSDDKDCTVRVTFRKNSATVQQSGNCGCGLNVNLSGEYRRRSNAKSTKLPANPN